MNTPTCYPSGDAAQPLVSDTQYLNAAFENMHLFATDFHIKNNIFILLSSFIYYTSIFPLDKSSFEEFSNT